VTQLHTRLVGTTGLRLTELAFGAASLGNLYRATSDDEASGAVTRAWKCGMRYFRHGTTLRTRPVGASARSGAVRLPA
jgi:D-threo-aldose 1-dehydrogenase